MPVSIPSCDGPNDKPKLTLRTHIQNMGGTMGRSSGDHKAGVYSVWMKAPLRLHDWNSHLVFPIYTCPAPRPYGYIQLGQNCIQLTGSSEKCPMAFFTCSFSEGIEQSTNPDGTFCKKTQLSKRGLALLGR